MSRGFSITVDLVREQQNDSHYLVKASGWRELEPANITATIVINRASRKLRFIPTNDWANEIFYIPPYDAIEHFTVETIPEGSLNEYYSWWNIQLIHALHRILTKEEYREHVWFYQ